jgi:hypothetical protein
MMTDATDLAVELILPLKGSTIAGHNSKQVGIVAGIHVPLLHVTDISTFS